MARPLSPQSAREAASCQILKVPPESLDEIALAKVPPEALCLSASMTDRTAVGARDAMSSARAPCRA
eukprot:697174-Pyramimonas_sp.AAC.1